MKKIVYIEKDEHNAIAICKDGFQGVVVQLIRFVDQLKPAGLEQEITKIRTKQVIGQWQVEVKNLQDGSLNEDFRKHVDDAINQAKNKLASIHNQDKKISGLLDNYFSQNRSINEDYQ